MQIGRHLVLSTAHVRVEIARLLGEWAKLPAADQPLAIASTQYGWFVATREPLDRTANVPLEIGSVLAFGRAHDCDYILFDCDGPEEASLPIYPW